MSQNMFENLSNFEFAGYDFSGGYDDGYTIFMFIDSNDSEIGFTLSLRDHEGHSDHNEVHYEGTENIPQKRKNEFIHLLKQSLENIDKDELEAIEIFNRCIGGVNS